MSQRLDERAVVVVDRVAEQALVDAVGQAARVEAVLKCPAPLVVHGPMISRRDRPGKAP